MSKNPEIKEFLASNPSLIQVIEFVDAEAKKIVEKLKLSKSYPVTGGE